MPNRAEQVTAIPSAVGAIGLLSTVGLAIAAGFDLLQLLLDQRLVERWEMWKPSIDAMPGDDVSPMFEALVVKMRSALNPQ